MMERIKNYFLADIPLKYWIILCSLMPMALNIYQGQKTPLPLLTHPFLEELLATFKFFELDIYRTLIVIFLFFLMAFARRSVAIMACWTMFFIQLFYVIFFYTEVLELTQLSIFYPLLILNFFYAPEKVRASARLFLVVFFLSASLYKFNRYFISGAEFFPGSVYYPMIRTELRAITQQLASFLSISSIVIKIIAVFFLFINVRIALFCILFFWFAIFFITPIAGGVSFLASLPILTMAFFQQEKLKAYYLVFLSPLFFFSWLWQHLIFSYAFPVFGFCAFLLFTKKCLIDYKKGEDDKLFFKGISLIPAIIAIAWSLLPLQGLTTRPLGFTMFAFPPFTFTKIVRQHYSEEKCRDFESQFIFHFAVALKRTQDGCVVLAPNSEAFIRLQARSR